MIYKLQTYMYKNRKIYKRIWGLFYKCIEKGPYSIEVGIGRINQLCGIRINQLCGTFGKETDYSTLTLLPINNEICGKFLTKFKKDSIYYLNDPLPAKIKPYKGRLDIQWDNGKSCIIDASHVNIYKKSIKG